MFASSDVTVRFRNQNDTIRHGYIVWVVLMCAAVCKNMGLSFLKLLYSQEIKNLHAATHALEMVCGYCC